MARTIGFVILLSLLVSASVGADIVKLKDGREFEGLIVEQDDEKIKLKTQLGAMVWKREDILEIIAQKSSVEILNERLLELRTSEPAKYLETGKWCIEEAKAEGIGLRLVNLAMALDPRLYVEGQLFLGDFYYERKNDRKKAAVCYQRALLSDPTSPACNERYERVKDVMKDSGSACDQKLVDGIRNTMMGNYDQAQDDLDSGRNSVMRPRAEEILGGPLQDVIDYCVFKTGCKACKGTRTTACTMCKGAGERECQGGCGGKGYLVRRSVSREEARFCDECKGWGKTLCTTCKAERVVQAMSDGRATFTTPQLAGPTAQSTRRPTYTIQGGTVPCRACRGMGGREVPPPDPGKLQEACAAIDRQVRGLLTLWEQSLTRMPRVGGPGQIEDAQKFLARPVWWNGDFVSVDTRRKADPNFGKGSTAGVSDADRARKGARPLVPGSEAPSQFELTIRKTLGLGGAAAVGQKQVFSTDFAARASGGSGSGAGPAVEVGEGGRRLRPCLVEIAEEFSARRIELDAGDGQGLALAEALSSSAWSSSGAVVRVYYTVVDSKEVVTPDKDRVAVVTRLIVKVTLVDVLDATGKVLQTTK